MTIRYAVADGLWSDPTTWDGGTAIPGAADTVYAGGFTVAVHQNIEVSLLSTVGDIGLSIPEGGTFNVDDGLAITGSVIAGLSTCVTGQPVTGDPITITGDATGGQESACGIYAASVIIGGNVVGGSGTAAHGAYADTALTVGGNATGGGGDGAYGAYADTALTVGGNATGGGGVSAHGAYAFTALTVGGNATGGGGVSAYGAFSGGNLTVTGNATGGGAAAAYGAVAWSQATVSGDATASATASAVLTPTVATVGGMITNSPDRVAVVGNLRCIAGQPLIIRMYDDADPPQLRTVTDSPWEVEVSPGVTASFRLMMTATVSSTGAQIAAATTA